MDYQMRLAERGGANISSMEYLEWRTTGSAYDFGGTTGKSYCYSAK